MNVATLVQTISISALPVIFAITLHEAAHGYAARHFGDQTAWAAGRVSLNPLRHVDPVGTLLVPGGILMLSYLIGAYSGQRFDPILFGWAKPVPVNFGRLRQPKRDMLWVAAAGPAVNLLMALVWAALLKLVDVTPSHMYTRPLALMSLIGININLMLMVLNMLPLPPLDGGRIAVSLLPYRLAIPFSRLERWGFPILLLLLFTNTLDLIIWPVIVAFRHSILGFLQLI
ncbi:MAG: site-2 protease family protein [Candidatus Accumulibacter sp.]|jgi:Zn-dependent protease|nr:site-2 protease family protein [Accumulibacter sp.]